MRGDLVLGIVTLAVAVLYYRMTAAIPQSVLADAVGPQGLPRVYAVVLVVLSCILIARSVPDVVRGTRTPRRVEAPGHGPSKVGARSHVRRAMGLLLIGVAYVAAAPYVGYLPALAVLIIATTHYQGRPLDTQTVAVGVGGAIVMWLFFVQLLGIPEPPGLWPDLF